MFDESFPALIWKFYSIVPYYFKILLEGDWIFHGFQWRAIYGGFMHFRWSMAGTERDKVIDIDIVLYGMGWNSQRRWTFL